MSSLTSASPGATLGVPARPGLAVPATPRFNLLMAGLSLLMAGVFVLNQWAASHNLVTDADVLPWTLLLRTFQVTLDLNKLLLAAGGILATAFAWWVLGAIFTAVPYFLRR